MIVYLFIAVLLLILELTYFKVADKYNIIDKPNLRSSHSSIVLRGGGIIFLFGAWLYAIFYSSTCLWFLLGLTMLGCISFADDIHPVPNKFRLVVQFFAMTLMFYQWGILQYVPALSMRITSWMALMASLVVIHWLYLFRCSFLTRRKSSLTRTLSSLFYSVCWCSVFSIFVPKQNALPVMWVVYLSHLFCSTFWVLIY